jgi:hypothetical protein
VLHPDKTVFMLFSSRNQGEVNASVYIDNNNYGANYIPELKTPILCVNNMQSPKVKFLGVILDPNLNFRPHIKTISAKISNSLYHLRAAKNILSQKALTTLYYSLIHSHLIYAIHIWSCAPNSTLKELITKQKIALRIIHNSSYNAHTESLFKTSAILPLHMLADFFKLQFMHQHKFKHLPASFNNTWTTNAERWGNSERPTLRDEEDYYIPHTRLCSLDQQPLVYFPKIWNDFVKEFGTIGSIPSKTLFKKELKSHFLNKLTDDYQCGRLLCPHCHL